MGGTGRGGEGGGSERERGRRRHTGKEAGREEEARPGRSDPRPMGASAPAQCAGGGGARAVRKGPGRGRGAAAREARRDRAGTAGVPLRPARGWPGGEEPPGRGRRRGAEALYVRVVFVLRRPTVLLPAAPAALQLLPANCSRLEGSAWRTRRLRCSKSLIAFAASGMWYTSRELMRVMAGRSCPPM